jgi:hypothetical protein
MTGPDAESERAAHRAAVDAGYASLDGYIERWEKTPASKLAKAEKVDHVVAAVRADLLRRSEIGIAKYGVTLDRTDLSLRDWLQHAYEETLDQANYLKRAIVEIDNAKN